MIAQLIAALTAAALTLPRPSGPETDHQYEARVGRIATAVALETQDVRLWTHQSRAAAVLSIWYGESRFALDVHSGAKLGDRGKAACLGQLHPSGLVPDWERLTGTGIEATRRCAAATIRVLRSQAARCGAWGTDRIASAFGAYARGNGCEPTPKTPLRVARWRRIVGRLWLPP